MTSVSQSEPLPLSTRLGRVGGRRTRGGIHLGRGSRRPPVLTDSLGSDWVLYDGVARVGLTRGSADTRSLYPQQNPPNKVLSTSYVHKYTSVTYPLTSIVRRQLPVSSPDQTNTQTTRR